MEKLKKIELLKEYGLKDNWTYKWRRLIKNEIKEVTNDPGDSDKIIDDSQESEITEVVQSV